jgi:GT2 family glycosyltransferase
VSFGKFPLHRGNRFLIKGVSYGTFAADRDGWQFPSPDRVASDFALMAYAGINTVRVYTPPPMSLLDEASRQGLRVMIGLPWMQDVAFLDDAALCRQIRRDVDREVRRVAGHESTLLFAIGNEIPSSIVRWHGRARIERFIRDLYRTAKNAAPDHLVTYVNYPPTDYLDLPFLDVVAFNVYLHRECDLRAYLARLQHVAGNRPLLLAEAGADAFRNGEEGQAELTAMQLRAALEEGAWGAIAFNWTDEWWRGGHDIKDWSFGLVDRDRRPKPALAAVSQVFADAPFQDRRSWPKVSVVVCVHNAAATLGWCLDALDRLDYPDYEVIVVDDGSVDATAAIAGRHPRVTTVRTPHAGLSAARNAGASRAGGEIVAYVDGDARPEPDWLTYLVQPFLSSAIAAAGGPNVVPPDDGWFSQCVARAPGSPQHVLLDDRIAEHIPGCNMAFRREVLLALDGFNPAFDRAGDDVDLCWRLQARGWEIGFAPAALVWHKHRSTLRAYWRQQVGYGESEAWLKPLYPEKFLGRSPIWRGHIYSALPFVRSLRRSKVNTGVWGSAAFPSVYRFDVNPFAYLPHSGRWQVASLAVLAFSLLLAFTPFRALAPPVGVLGTLAIAITIAKCFGYALKTDINSLPDTRRRPRALRRLFYRSVIAGLHFAQPLARCYGRARGYFIPPKTGRLVPPKAAPRSPTATPSSLGATLRSLKLITGASLHHQFWSEQRITAEAALARLTDWLRMSRAVDMIEVDDGWRGDRDLRVTVGRMVCFDIRSVVEDHGGGKSLLRLATRARPTPFGTFLLGAAMMVVGIGVLGAVAGRPAVALTGAALGMLSIPIAVWPVITTAHVVRQAIHNVTDELQMTPLSTATRPSATRATPCDRPAPLDALAMRVNDRPDLVSASETEPQL